MMPSLSEASSAASAAGQKPAARPRHFTGTVRAGSPADLDALVALESGAFSHDRLSRRSFTRFIASPRARLIVAESGQMLCGYALLLFRRGSGAARLYSLAVEKTSEGRGLGSTLLRAAEDAARRGGAGAMRLEVGVGNTHAARLYRKSGYRVVDQLPAYYEDGEDAWRLQKALAVPGHATRAVRGAQ